MMMTCIIIEDQPPAQRILKKFIEDIGTLKLEGTFSEAPGAMDFLKSNAIDIIFLDIHLPKLSGIDFLKILPHKPSIILTTAFSEYALESYELNVVDYLLKPFSFQRFVQAVSKVQSKGKAISSGDSKKKASQNEVFIKSGYDHIKIIISEIEYIKSDADYTEIFVNGKKHISTESLRFWLEYLAENRFVRIHKSYVVNTAWIKKVSGNQIFMTSEEVLPIGRAYKDQFSERFLKI